MCRACMFGQASVWTGVRCVCVMYIWWSDIDVRSTSPLINDVKFGIACSFWMPVIKTPHCWRLACATQAVRMNPFSIPYARTWILNGPGHVYTPNECMNKQHMRGHILSYLYPTYVICLECCPFMQHTLFHNCHCCHNARPWQLNSVVVVLLFLSECSRVLTQWPRVF